MPRQPAPIRANFKQFYPISTRWMDNDVYGHVNNVVYYSFFDTIANQYLIQQGVLDINRSESIGVMVHSECHYHKSIAYPDRLSGGLAVKHIGNTSVTYFLGIFREQEDTASAHGFMTHVFVERESQRPLAIGEELRSSLQQIAM